MKSIATNFVTIFFAVSISGCSIMQPVPGGASAWRTSVEVGDTVQVETTDGRTLNFQVSEVTDSGLRGEGQAVSYDAIAGVQKKTVSTWRTVGLIAGAVVAIALIAGGGGYGGGGGGDYDSGGSGGSSGGGGGGGGIIYP